MLWRWKWSYPFVLAALFVGSPSEPLDLVNTAQWDQADRRDNGTVRIAFVPDAGCLDVVEGKLQGYEYALLEAWEEAIPQKVEWLFARSASEALAWVEVGRADLAAGNIPSFTREGLRTSQPVRVFQWIQWGASDSLRYLNEYPKLAPFLRQSDSLPLAIESTTMWRHIPANEAGWVVPDVYLPALKAHSQPSFRAVPLGEGTFCWMGRTKDSLLIESVDAFLASKRARRIQGFYGRDSYHDDWLKPIELSPFDAYFTDSERFDRYTLTALAYVESRFRSDIVSPAGAVGVMQLIPNTASRLGIEPHQLYEPKRNIQAGLKYLRFLDQYWKQRGVPAENRLPFILASYNTGPTPIAR
ncbi:MAG: transglycosylase SLT domain-containing protein, partial [Schleiferiaceae bacterium]